MVSWVFQITRNVIADYYRAPNRRREVAAGLASDIEATHSTPAPPLLPALGESAGTRKELAGCLGPMIEQLPNPYREAVTLVELDGLTQQAAAKRLGLSLSGMKSRVQRGRRQLKHLIEECCVIQHRPSSKHHGLYRARASLYFLHPIFQSITLPHTIRPTITLSLLPIENFELILVCFKERNL